MDNYWERKADQERLINMYKNNIDEEALDVLKSEEWENARIN